MMQYKGYLGRVEFDAEARLLHGQVVGIRDVVTFQADSAAKIEKAFCDSVDDYLAFCKERGEEPNRPASGRFVVRVDSELHRSLNNIARASGKSLNSLVSEYLEREAAQAMTRTRPSPGRGSRPRSSAAKTARKTTAA